MCLPQLSGTPASVLMAVRQQMCGVLPRHRATSRGGHLHAGLRPVTRLACADGGALCVGATWLLLQSASRALLLVQCLMPGQAGAGLWVLDREGLFTDV